MAPRRNRVTPLSELIAVPERGLVYGNRGCLHDAAGEIRRQWATTRWIACRLQFRGRRRYRLMQPGRYTELFFLDDATALAAGHRPCAECRREDYGRLTELWARLHPGQRGAGEIDAQLHSERVVQQRAGGRLLYEVSLDDLPDGAFVLHDDRPRLVLGARTLAWSPGGYHSPQRRRLGERALVITPRSLVELLRDGWEPVVPLLHPSAGATT